MPFDFVIGILVFAVVEGSPQDITGTLSSVFFALVFGMAQNGHKFGRNDLGR